MANILVLDDVQEITVLLQRILESAGHEVAVACSVKDALDVLSKGPTDLVITDIFMPDRDGLEFIKDIRARYPSIKILVISGGGKNFPAQPFLTLAQHSGAQQTLMKPFGPAALRQAVSELLST
jgi:CheY-like chemotaxis protein